MPVVIAKCPNCGAKIDPNQTSGICTYCGSPFITEKANALPSYESKCVDVIADKEAETLSLWQGFGWTVGNIFDAGDATKKSITFRRNRRMPNYDKLLKVESNYWLIESDKKRLKGQVGCGTYFVYLLIVSGITFVLDLCGIKMNTDANALITSACAFLLLGDIIYFAVKKKKTLKRLAQQQDAILQEAKKLLPPA
jgi:hypothetical protein